MIQFNNINKEIPYLIFMAKYKKALNAGQKAIEAIAISSFNTKMLEVESRYVNLKFIENDKFIFLGTREGLTRINKLSGLVRDYNYNFILNKTSKQYYDDSSHILLNINHTRKSFQKKETISPIIVKKYFDSELYYIVKGKHRFLMTLFENRDFINSIICN